MPTYLMLTNLTAEGLRTLKNNPTRVTEVNQEVEQMGGKVVTQYADGDSRIAAKAREDYRRVALELTSLWANSEKPTKVGA